MTENPYRSPASESGNRGVPSRAWMGVFVAAVAIPIVGELLLLHFLDRLPRFAWLSTQCFGGMWPGVLALVLWVASRAEATPRLLWLSPLLILPTTMLTWAAIYERAAPPRTDQWPVHVLFGLFLASMPLSVVAVVTNRGQRWLVAVIAFLSVIWCLSSYVIGGMAITGQWI